MFCGLGDKKRTRFRKNKKEKKKKKKGEKVKKPHRAKSRLVGMKGYLKIYNRVKYFLPYLSRL